MKVNVGCGSWPLPGWVNLDMAADSHADVLADGTRLPFCDASLDEIYAGHFVEHLEQHEADAFLTECWRCLKPEGKLGVVVPDTRAVMTKYLAGERALVEYPVGSWVDVSDLDDVCSLFLYSTRQASPHRWSYDVKTLQRLLERNRFQPTGEINRWFDARIPVGAWYQCGLEAVKDAA